MSSVEQDKFVSGNNQLRRKWNVDTSVVSSSGIGIFEFCDGRVFVLVLALVSPTH